MKLIGRRTALGAGATGLIGAASAFADDVPVRDAMSGSKNLAARRAVVGLTPTTIGGIQLYSEGPPGSPYEGFRLIGGDDFDGGPPAYHPTLNSGGRYYNARTNTLNQGTASPLSKLSGPNHFIGSLWSSGCNDYNRGQPVASFADLLSVRNGLLTLKGRGPNPREQLLFDASQESTAPFLGDSFLHFMHPCVWECSARCVAFSASQDLGSVCFIWADPMLYGKGGPEQGVELDYDGASQTCVPGWYLWGSVGGLGAPLSGYTISQNTSAPIPGLWNGAFHKTMIKTFADWVRVEFWIDDKLVKTTTDQTYAPSGKMPYYMHTNIALGGTYQVYEYAILQLEYWRLWQPIGRRYLQARVPSIEKSFAWGDTFDEPFPSTLELWGTQTLVADRTAAVPYDSMTPGMSRCGGFQGRRLPLGVTDTGGRLQGTYVTSPGQIVYQRAGGDDGDVCEVWKVKHNVGPVIATPATINITPGQPLGGAGVMDIYWDLICGNLIKPNLTITGSLPSGVTLSTDESTFYQLLGTPAAGATVTLNLTNGVGQPAVPKTVTFAQPTPGSGIGFQRWPGFASVAAAGWIGILDPDDFSTLTLASGVAGAGGVVSAIAGAYGTTASASQSSGSARPTSVTRNNRGALRFTRSSSQWLNWNSLANLFSFGEVGGYSIVMVVRNVSTAAPSQTWLDLGHAAVGPTTQRAVIGNNSGLVQWQAVGGGSVFSTCQSSEAIDTTVHVWFFRQNGQPRGTGGAISNSGGATITRDRRYGFSAYLPEPGFASGALNPVDSVTLGALTANSAQSDFADVELLFVGALNRFMEDHEMRWYAAQLAGAFGTP